MNTEHTIFPKKKWERSTPELQGVSSKSLENALKVLESYCAEDGIEQCLVVRNGYIIYEGAKCELQHNIWSSTKSITSTLLGLLIEDGKCKLDDFVAAYEPLLKEKYSRVTLRHFASMTSGYQAKPPTRWKNLKQDWSWNCYDPDEPLFTPGSAFCYWDNAQIMFGRVLTQIAGENLETYFTRKVGIPIEMGKFDWEKDPGFEIGGLPICYGGTGIHINAYQQARFGHLFLNEGMWNGKPVIPKSWVNLASSIQVPLSTPLANTERIDMKGSGIYGFNWWVNGITPEGNLYMPSTPHGTYFSSGLNNNLCFIVPYWNMVFVRLGTDSNPKEGKSFVYDKVFKQLGVSIKI